MNRIRAAVISSTIGLTGGNFLYQAFSAMPSWSTAVERSFFQLVAVLIVWSIVAANSYQAND